MSSALAMAGVTAVLRDLLRNGLIDHDVEAAVGTAVTVSVLPPDRVVASNGSEASQLNLFLHQVTPNQGWRNEGLPSRDTSGRTRLANPPLALDLHYLLSAYSAEDLHGEILLGYAMQLLHENPVISRQSLGVALDPSPDVGETLPEALRALADCGLADQVEHLRITPEYLDTEQMSKLWTATQSHYRPTAAYQVTVVLIESEQPTRAPLPVLSRGPVDPVSGRERGVVVVPHLIPPVPTLEEVRPAGRQVVARLGETVALVGHHLDGANRRVNLENARFEVEEQRGAKGGSEATRIQFVIPTADAADFPVGTYQISAELERPGESTARETNRLGLVIAPAITAFPAGAVVRAGGTASFSLSFRPELREGQTVSLLLGEREVAPESFTAPTGTLDFVVPSAEAGNHLARLRIDGIESPVIDRSVEPPQFFDHRIRIT